MTLPGRPTPYTAASADLYDFTDVDLTQFDDQGDLVFTLGSAPGGSGTDVVMVAHLVPEPTSFVLAFLASSMFALRRAQFLVSYTQSGPSCQAVEVENV